MSLRAPTPPTPPTIDKGDLQPSEPRIDARQFFEVPEMPFRKKTDEEETPAVEENPVVEETPEINRQETTPESMARDAVAHGAGALTKREVTRPDDNARNTNPPPVVNAPNPNSESYERGQAVLREFRELDDNANENPASTITPSNFHNQSNAQSHGGIFWIVTLIFVVAAAFIIAKKFLFRSKPKLKKSDLFQSSGEKLKSATKKFSKPAEPPKPADKKLPPVKPARLPKKDDDDKGKHFEVRI